MVDHFNPDLRLLERSLNRAHFRGLQNRAATHCMISRGTR
jgi:hypothetical protein